MKSRSSDVLYTTAPQKVKHEDYVNDAAKKIIPKYFVKITKTYYLA